MRITVRSFAMIREIFGKKEISIDLSDGSTVLSLIDDLLKKYTALNSILYYEGSINKSNVIALNDMKIEPDSFSLTFLKENDIIHIIPPAGGG